MPHSWWYQGQSSNYLLPVWREVWEANVMSPPKDKHWGHGNDENAAAQVSTICSAQPGTKFAFSCFRVELEMPRLSHAWAKCRFSKAQPESQPDLQPPDSGIHVTLLHEQRQIQNHFIALSSVLCQRGAKAPPMKTLRHWQGQPGCLPITHQPVARLLYRHIIQASGYPKTMADRERASALLTLLPS